MQSNVNPPTRFVWFGRGLAFILTALIILLASTRPAQAQGGNCTPTPTLLRNEATVVADQNDANPGDNTGAVCVAVVAPSYSLSKVLTSPGPMRVGDDITFTIRITNTGSTPLSLLPLRDIYDPASMLYLSANVAPDDAINDGQLDWSDLTTSFSQDLAPGASFTVNTVFFARSDTSFLPGQVTVNTARVLLTPSQTTTATVQIEAPTGVDLAGHSVRYDLTGGVTLEWSTANETEIVGFHLLRREPGKGGWVQLNPELILAQQPGQTTGASYTFTDANVEFGHTYLYLVEVVDGSGNTTRRELGLVVAGSRVLLPLIAR